MRLTIPTARAAGVVFGVVQLVLGFFAAGMGHGSYIPIGLAAAPMALLSLALDNAAPAFLGVIPLWGGYALLAAWWGRSGNAKVRGRMLLIAHNLLGLLIVSPWSGTPYSDWHTFAQYWPLETFYLAPYVAGQWMAWVLLPHLDEVPT